MGVVAPGEKKIQLAVKTQLIYGTICTVYIQLHVSAYFRPSSSCII